MLTLTSLKTRAVVTRCAILMAVLVTGLAAPVPAAAQNAAQLTRFNWLAGTWFNSQAGTYEEWRLNSSANRWEGRAFRVVAATGDTVITERLSIECASGASGDCHYVADVAQNAAPVRFRITSHTATGFRSENPAHDFPKFIEYRAGSDSVLVATIGAGTQTMTFEFRRTRRGLEAPQNPKPEPGTVHILRHRTP